MNSNSVMVNYDGEPLLEVEHQGVDYRFDTGKQGTALCVSSRTPGSWDWQFVGEAKFDRVSLRCPELERSIREHLARALRDALDTD